VGAGGIAVGTGVLVGVAVGGSGGTVGSAVAVDVGSAVGVLVGTAVGVLVGTVVGVLEGRVVGAAAGGAAGANHNGRAGVQPVSVINTNTTNHAPHRYRFIRKFPLLRFTDVDDTNLPIHTKWACDPTSTWNLWYAVCMMTQRPTTISFDIGYTLIEPHMEAPAIVTTLLQDLGVEHDAATLQAAYVRAERLFIEDYLRPLNDTWTADRHIERFYTRYYVQLLADLGVDDPDAQHARTIIARYLDPSNWRTYPDVLPALDALREQGYHLGAASDWGTNLLGILRALGLSRYLEWVVISGAVGAAKPSPHFYELVVRRAGVPPAQIVHVGDSYYGDVQGARTVGAQAVLIDRARRWPPLDVPVIHQLGELATLLA
jgi:putative hydrolase of the HAD superfamily